MNTPLYNTLKRLSAYPTARFHMPGHKGAPVFSDFAHIFALDYTETYETGNLYEEAGPIRLAEHAASRFYSAADCHFLTGGSSQGVVSMLGAVCGDGGAVILDRTCHKSAMHACALFDLTPSFVQPSMLFSGCGGLLEISAVENALRAAPLAKALMVVSPNYYGVLQPIAQLADLCHRYGKRLLVDAAHGAHLPALGFSSPVKQGADAAVVSAHKTLPALGQGAYLLIGTDMDAAALRGLESICGTSSPSYPIMASLDLARHYLEYHAEAYGQAAREVSRLREKYNCVAGLRTLRTGDAPLDPLRFTIVCADGLALADTLYHEHNIACEMADRHNVVMIVTPADLNGNLSRLESALDIISYTQPLALPLWSPAPASKLLCSVRHALLQPCACVAPAQAVGKICARPVTPYPPGIPLLWPGEEITPKHIEFLTQRCYNTISEIFIQQ